MDETSNRHPHTVSLYHDKNIDIGDSALSNILIGIF
jgi:hypothetical protein